MRIAFMVLLGVINLSPVKALENTTVATLQLLNKISGKKRNVSIPLGSAYLIDELKIVPRGCKPAESLFADGKAVAVSVDVFIEQDEGDSVLLFQGDIFSSPHHPHHPIEHPIYDILVKDCQMSEPPIP